MNSQGMINVETLLPSSLLDEDHNSDNESDSSINFNKKLSLFNEEQIDDSPDQVIFNLLIIIYFNYYRKKILSLMMKQILHWKIKANRIIQKKIKLIHLLSQKKMKSLKMVYQNKPLTKVEILSNFKNLIHLMELIILMD